MCAIKDELSGFAPPITAASEEIATRYFRTQCSQSSLIQSSPKDFSIWVIGEYDTKTGEVTGYEKSQIRLLERAEGHEKEKEDK